MVPTGLLASCLSNDTVSYRLGRSATSSPLPCRLPHQPDCHHSGGRDHSLPAGLQCGPRGCLGRAAGAVDHGQRAPHPFLLHHPLRLTAAVPGSGCLSPGRVYLHVPGEEVQLLPGGVRYVLLFCCLLVLIPSPPLVLIPSPPLVLIPSPPLVLIPSPPLSPPLPLFSSLLLLFLPLFSSLLLLFLPPSPCSHPFSSSCSHPFSSSFSPPPLVLIPSPPLSSPLPLFSSLLLLLFSSLLLLLFSSLLLLFLPPSPCSHPFSSSFSPCSHPFSSSFSPPPLVLIPSSPPPVYPQIETISTSTQARIDTAVRLNCSATGNPTPQVQY